MTAVPSTSTNSAGSITLQKNYVNKIVPISGPIGYLGSELLNEHLIRIINVRPPSYISRDRNTDTHTRTRNIKPVEIRAPIQEEFGMQTEAQWQPLTAAYVINRVGNEAIQAIAQRTTVNRYTSRRVWTGTSPIRFNLNLNFLAVSDPLKEVIYPVMELQRMSLPYAAGWLGDYFLRPPGPDPFDIGWMNKLTKIFTGEKRNDGDKITVKVGTFLTISECVVKMIGVKFSKNILRGGFPASAVASIDFETYEIPTKDSLDMDIGKNESLYSNGVTMMSTTLKEPGESPTPLANQSSDVFRA